MVAGGDGDGPELVGELGQKVPPVQGVRPAVELHPLLVGEARLGGLLAETLELVGVHAALNGAVPGVGAPLGENGVDVGAKEGLQHGPDPIEQGLEGVDGVGAVLVRPKLLDEFRLGHVPIPVDDEIGQDVPYFLRAVDLVGKDFLVNIHGETAQQGDGNLSCGGGIAHSRHLLSVQNGLSEFIA